MFVDKFIGSICVSPGRVITLVSVILLLQSFSTFFHIYAWRKLRRPHCTINPTTYSSYTQQSASMWDFPPLLDSTLGADSDVLILLWSVLSGWRGSINDVVFQSLWPRENSLRDFTTWQIQRLGLLYASCSFKLWLFFLLCPRTGESVPSPWVLSLPTAGWRFPVTLSLSLFSFTVISFVVQKLFSQPLVLQEELLYI